jgi:hypothetical protein
MLIMQRKHGDTSMDQHLSVFIILLARKNGRQKKVVYMIPWSTSWTRTDRLKEADDDDDDEPASILVSCEEGWDLEAPLFLKQQTSRHRCCRCHRRRCRLPLEKAEEEIWPGEAHGLWAYGPLLLPWAFSGHGLIWATVTWQGAGVGGCMGAGAVWRTWCSWHQRERERGREMGGKEGGGY